MKSFKVILSVIIILAGLATATAAYYKVVYIDGTGEIKTHTMSYYIFMPKFIKEFPVISPVSEPNYYRRPEIVCESPEAVMEYRSDKNMVELIGIYSKEFNERGISMEETEVDSGKSFDLNREPPTVITLIPTERGQTDIRITEYY